MTKTIIALIMGVLLQTTLQAQRHTYIGMEGAVTTDLYDYVDNGSLLKEVKPLGGYYGITFRQDLNKVLFLEGGLLRKAYQEGLGFKVFSGYSTTNAINAWLLPLRLGTRINLHKQKVHFVTLIGFVAGINSDYGYGAGGLGGYEKSPSDSVAFQMQSKLSLRRTFPLMQTGAGVEFLLRRTALLSLTMNYYTGFKNLMEQDISYYHQGTTFTAIGLSKGEMVSYGLAVKYPISHIWR